MKLYFLFFSIILCGCNSKNENMRMIFHFSVPSNEIFEIDSDDLLYVDWLNQYYYLKDNLGMKKDSLNLMLCYGEATLSVKIGGEELYGADFYCTISPTNKSGNDNVIFLYPVDDSLNVFYKNRIQLNTTKNDKLIKEKEDQNKYSNFLYNKRFKQYLNQRGLIKE